MTTAKCIVTTWHEFVEKEIRIANRATFFVSKENHWHSNILFNDFSVYFYLNESHKKNSKSYIFSENATIGSDFKMQSANCKQDNL